MAAKRYALHRWYFDGSTPCKRCKFTVHAVVVRYLHWPNLHCQMAPPHHVVSPTECLWWGSDDGFVAIFANSNGHGNGHGDQWVRLPSWGFLLVFCSNHSPKMHRCWAMGMEQTDRQKDQLQQCLMPPHHIPGHNNSQQHQHNPMFVSEFWHSLQYRQQAKN